MRWKLDLDAEMIADRDVYGGRSTLVSNHQLDSTAIATPVITPIQDVTDQTSWFHRNKQALFRDQLVSVKIWNQRSASFFHCDGSTFATSANFPSPIGLIT